jgi:23S rRNA (guanine2445-N2)-methyltransferase / 23S rRNA (guanine2069-N7)-methyltransferase
MSKWNSQGDGGICDPMCGSGTIGIEAALLRSETAPGLVRYSHSQFPKCVSWLDISRSQWLISLEDAMNRDKRAALASDRNLPPLYLNDRHPGAIQLAISAAKLAGVHSQIKFSCNDVAELRLPYPVGMIL